MYFEPITSLFGRAKRREEQLKPADEFARKVLVQRGLSSYALAAITGSSGLEAHSEHAPGRRKALVIEPDSATSNAVFDSLASSGVEIDWAPDSDTTIRYLSRNSYDVVILDLDLAKINAAKGFIEVIQLETPANAIVVTDADPSEVRRLLPNVGIVPKPIISSQLLRTIQMCVGAAATDERKQTA